LTDQDCPCDYCTRPRPDRNKDQLISMAEFCRRAGNRSHMWPIRRLSDPKFRFPEPVYTGRFRAVWESDAMAWLDSPQAAIREPRDRNWPERSAA